MVSSGLGGERTRHTVLRWVAGCHRLVQASPAAAAGRPHRPIGLDHGRLGHPLPDPFADLWLASLFVFTYRGEYDIMEVANTTTISPTHHGNWAGMAAMRAPL